MCSIQEAKVEMPIETYLRVWSPEYLERLARVLGVPDADLPRRYPGRLRA